MFDKRIQIAFLAVLIIIYTISLSYFAILRHNAFSSGYDLGNMDQTVWNTLHGRFFDLTGDTGTISRFSIHGDIFLVLLAPLYILWDNVRILLILQSLFLALGAIPVFLLAKKLLQNSFQGFLLVGIYLLNPGMQWTGIYDFHSVAFAISFMLFAFYFGYTKQWIWYVVFIVLAMTTKEEIPLSVAMLGIMLAIINKSIRVGIATFLVGIIWTGVMVKVIIPHYNTSHTYSFFSWYQLIESNIASAKFINIPKVIFANFFATPDASSYFSILLKEYALLPLIGLPWILLAAPDLLINILSDHAQMRSIFFQYDSGIIPGLMIASIFAIYYIQIVLKKFNYRTKFIRIMTNTILVGAVIIAGRVMYGYSPLPVNPNCWCIMYQVADDDRQFDKILQQIPQNASVAASPEIRPHTTHRENAFTIPVATGSADFVALIDQNRIVGNYEPKDQDLLQNVMNNNNYQLVSHLNHFYLFKNIHRRS